MQDKAGNVLIRKPATAGKENITPVVFQSHMDMVCEKNADVDFDFEKDAIQPYIDGQWVKAKAKKPGPPPFCSHMFSLLRLFESSCSFPPFP